MNCDAPWLIDAERTTFYAASAACKRRSKSAVPGVSREEAFLSQRLANRTVRHRDLINDGVATGVGRSTRSIPGPCPCSTLQRVNSFSEARRNVRRTGESTLPPVESLCDYGTRRRTYRPLSDGANNPIPPRSHQSSSGNITITTGFRSSPGPQRALSVTSFGPCLSFCTIADA